MSTLLIYWIGILDDIKCLCAGITVTSCFVIIIMLAFWLHALSDGKELIGRSTKIVAELFSVLLVLSLFLSAFLPSSKTLTAMYILPHLYNDVVENEEIKKLPDNVVELANEWIEELKPSNSNSERKQDGTVERNF